MSKIGIVDSDPLQGMDEAKAWKVASGDWVMLDTLKVCDYIRDDGYLRGAVADLADNDLLHLESGRERRN